MRLILLLLWRTKERWLADCAKVWNLERHMNGGQAAETARPIFSLHVVSSENNGENETELTYLAGWLKNENLSIQFSAVKIVAPSIWFRTHKRKTLHMQYY